MVQENANVIEKTTWTIYWRTWDRNITAVLGRSVAALETDHTSTLPTVCSPDSTLLFTVPFDYLSIGLYRGSSYQLDQSVSHRIVLVS